MPTRAVGCLSFPICKWGAQMGRQIPALLPHHVLSSREVPAAVTTLPRLRSPFRKAWGGGEAPGVGKPRLTSAGSAPRGPGWLRAGTGNGSATRARRPQRQLEAPRGRRGTPEGPGHPSLARSTTRSHSPGGRGIAPSPVSLARFPGWPCLPTPTALVFTSDARAPAQPNLLPGPAPTCPASEPPRDGGRERGWGGNSRSNQSRPELHSCARPDWAAL